MTPRRDYAVIYAWIASRVCVSLPALAEYCGIPRARVEAAILVGLESGGFLLWEEKRGRHIYVGAL